MSIAISEIQGPSISRRRTDGYARNDLTHLPIQLGKGSQLAISVLRQAHKTREIRSTYLIVLIQRLLENFGRPASLPTPIQLISLSLALPFSFSEILGLFRGGDVGVHSGPVTGF